MLSEPVSLSISTMKQQYENARSAAQDNFSKSHASLCNDCNGHSKLHQKLEGKARDFTSVLASSQEMASSSINSSAMDADQALALLQQYATLQDKDRKAESKLRHLVDEMREIQQRVAESNASLKQKYNSYIQVCCAVSLDPRCSL